MACAGCGGGDADTSSSSSSALSAAAALGQQIFSDVSLSAGGKQSCASCHDPDHAHGPANNLAVQLGGANLDVPGFRAAPSLRYLKTTPAFFFDAEDTPTGGFNLDGRVDTLQAQARRPFLAPHEMANADIPAVIIKLANASYAVEFRRVFGDTIFSDPQAAFDRVVFALQRFQLEDASFAPFSSKYDAFLAGNAKLGDAELRGLALFNSASKGNCAACHPSAHGADGSPPLFTDFTYDNLGVPRNDEIDRNADLSYFDLGLCRRADLPGRADLCGAFKVPSLRNVALRQAFFHNGRFKSLKDALTFYVQRDTDPEKWYPTGSDGSLRKFDDLPPDYRANVNTTEAPYNRKPGDAPALSDAEIDDVIAFLRTLSDGYSR